MKKFLLTTASLLALASASHATVIFDGGTDTVLKASSGDVALGNPSTGTWTLTAGADSQAAYIFGNFSAATLSNVGDSLTLSFTTTDWPGSVANDTISQISFGLFGAGESLVTSDTTLDGFDSYEGFRRTNNVHNLSYNGHAPDDASNLADGGDAVSGASGSTGGGGDRFNYGDSADFTLAVTRTATAFEIGGSISVSGGSGVQTYNIGTFTPGTTGFQLDDSFTTLAIGIPGGIAATEMDDGAVMTFSDITVDHAVIPEPSSFALLAGALGLGLVIVRRRR